MKKMRPIVFYGPFILLLIAVISSLSQPKDFLAAMTAINNWNLENFSWMFSLTTLFFVGTCAWAFVSPLGRVKIGGPDAKPLLSQWNWFAIALCTTVAIGILFWATAEPMYHLHSPPKALGLEAGSPEAAEFALSTLFLHWSFTPYAIYTVPALAFALAFYNRGASYSLGGMLSTLFGKKTEGIGGEIIDAVAMFALIAGMAASLGTGMLTLAGGVQKLLGVSTNAFVLGVVAIAIVGSFVVSAVSGLMKGIRILSDFNTKFFFLLAAFVFVFGPTMYILSAGIDALGAYFNDFFQRSLYTGRIAGDPWPGWWTNFYWANWLAWAPITALFLGKISRGYTVRQFIMTTMIGPSLFAIVWMSIFGGMSIHTDMNNGGALKAALDSTGAESVIYTVFTYLPLEYVLVIAFFILSFISFVTAADSNTEAIASLCEDRHADDESPTSLPMKIIWGSMIGVVAWVMVAFSGIDGIKMLSNLGGLPAMFIVTGAAFCVWKIGLGVAKEEAVASTKAVSVTATAAE